MWLWFSFPLIFLWMKHELGRLVVDTGRDLRFYFKSKSRIWCYMGGLQGTTCGDVVLFVPEHWEVQNSVPAGVVSWHNPLQEMLGMLAWSSWPWRSWMGSYKLLPSLRLGDNCNMFLGNPGAESFSRGQAVFQIVFWWFIMIETTFFFLHFQVFHCSKNLIA